MTDTTFFWHDYETFGVEPRRDRPAQFAGIRTDSEFNQIGDPVMHYCQPTLDYLPDPEACLITGITPQYCLEKGLLEYHFAAAIEKELSFPGTIGLGYNTLRFDDEVTRALFWRNLIDPYAREWQNECSRWDLLDVVRCAYALRPEGIIWPDRVQGGPSFKLEHLSIANGLIHDTAHDALSDVKATIALARLIRNKQPKLLNFCFALRKKETVKAEIGLDNPKPFLHISGMFPAERGCIAVVYCLGQHPTNRNEIIVWDLAFDPSELFELDATAVRQRLFTRADEQEKGTTRLPIKSIHLNKSPIVIGNLKTLSPESAEKWGIDMKRIQKHTVIAKKIPDLSLLWAEVFKPTLQMYDVDEDIYSGFIGNRDRRTLNHLRTLSPEQLATESICFDDSRLVEILFRYRARNFPESLSRVEKIRWQHHCTDRLHNGGNGARTHLEYLKKIDNTMAHCVNERDKRILEALRAWGEKI